MDQNDRHTIENLFDRLSEAERNAPERDADAEALIRERLGRQPDAPYYMLQTIAVQQQALEALQQRVTELEQRNAGGFLGRLFGGAPAPSRPVGTRKPAHTAPYGAPGASLGRPYQGGGFMAGAMQTAAGVAGGVLIGSALSDMLMGDAAAAEEPAPEEEMDFGDEEM